MDCCNFTKRSGAKELTCFVLDDFTSSSHAHESLDAEPNDECKFQTVLRMFCSLAPGPHWDYNGTPGQRLEENLVTANLIIDPGLVANKFIGSLFSYPFSFFQECHSQQSVRLCTASALVEQFDPQTDNMGHRADIQTPWAPTQSWSPWQNLANTRNTTIARELPPILRYLKTIEWWHCFSSGITNAIGHLVCNCRWLLILGRPGLVWPCKCRCPQWSVTVQECDKPSWHTEKIRGCFGRGWFQLCTGWVQGNLCASTMHFFARWSMQRSVNGNFTTVFSNTFKFDGRSGLYERDVL